MNFLKELLSTICLKWPDSVLEVDIANLRTYNNIYFLADSTKKSVKKTKKCSRYFWNQ